MDQTISESSSLAASYGLRHQVLSPMETLAQSVSTMAPTTTPAATSPLVCALAGNGTWLAYVLATIAVLLVALCIARFARQSASPGSLYTYATMTLPPWMSAAVAWSLLLAYVATGSSVIGGFYHYANLLLHDAFDLRGFYPVAPDLQLVIHSSQEFDIPIRQPPAQVSGTIETRIRPGAEWISSTG